jgi:hypothetical protein
MTEMCSFPGDRDGALIAYVYNELAGADRAAFESHATTCPVCRDEIRALGGVRELLAHWSPPEPAFMIPGASMTSIAGPRLARGNPPSVLHKPLWKELPAWAQVAAALLFLGVSAGIANLEIHRDQSGLTIRTGWSRSVGSPPVVAERDAAAPVSAAPQRTAQTEGVTREDLAALERQLRTEFRGVQMSMRPVSDPRPMNVGAASADADLMRRVRALIEETEKRQNRELALRIGEVLRDVNAQRQADLVRIDRSLGLVQNDLGVEVLKQRQSLNYLMRVNQR